MSIDQVLQRAVAGVQALHPYLPGKPLSELEREYGISNAIKLASNENPLGPGTKAQAAISALQGDELARYPDGNGFELKTALAAHLNQARSITSESITPESITLGNGSNDILDLIARAFLGPGREAVFSQYAFIVYPIATQAVGATARIAVAKDYGHDLAAMRAEITDATSVVFIANPNNPTGTCLGKQALYDFFADLPPHIVVVVDEAYHEYVDESDYPDSMQWLSEFPNLIVTRTFSKIHALAALRIGYAVSDPAVADLLNRVRQPFNVNTLAQTAALAALSDHEHVQNSKAENIKGMSELQHACDALKLETIPSSGNFLTVDMGRPAAADYEALLRRGVIVRPLANYGLPNHLRMTIGTTEEIKRLITALQDLKADLKPNLKPRESAQ